jgi:hypothetical protein
MAFFNTLVGFYEDQDGAVGVFTEDLHRVLGPQSGHLLASGAPGSGKTSLYLSFLTCLYTSLRDASPRVDASGERSHAEPSLAQRPAPSDVW